MPARRGDGGGEGEGVLCFFQRDAFAPGGFSHSVGAGAGIATGEREGSSRGGGWRLSGKGRARGCAVLVVYCLVDQFKLIMRLVV